MFDKNDIAAIPKTSIDIEFPGAGSPKKTGVKKSQRFKDIENLDKLPKVWLE